MQAFRLFTFVPILAGVIVLFAAENRAQAAEPKIDLTHASIVTPARLDYREKKAVAMLVEEIQKRTSVRLLVRSDWPAELGSPVILVGRNEVIRKEFPQAFEGKIALNVPQKPESFAIGASSHPPRVVVSGNDTRGLFFGIGRLLRELAMTRGKVALGGDFSIATSPAVALRGHQLGYRPKTHSYDAWDLPQWEQYFRDLVVFGTNAIELVPPRTDDDVDSPHFPRPPMEMMVAMSSLADEYDLDVWVWYPAMDKDYSNPATVEFAINEWAQVFQKLKRIDAIFVPGGDPGHTQPKHMMALLEKQAKSLARFHPRAQMWMSPQSFNREWHEEFLDIMKQEPKWLTGIVFGPQVRVGLHELRESIPKKYPIRHYPDITHSINCQYPVPEWDLAYALTYDREAINPRPLGQAAIFAAGKDESVGFLTYSEGCNDDVNKFVWSGLGWEPATPVVDILRQYSRYFVGETYRESLAQGLLALERNWRGPLLSNDTVETTLLQFQQMERAAMPADLLNWRFQQALYRAYYDANVRDRLIRETAIETEARKVLRNAEKIGVIPAIDEAQTILRKALFAPASDRRVRVDQLAEALFQSIQMQLSVKRYRAIEVGRGTTQDSIDTPLNDRLWLESEFASIRALPTERERLERLTKLENRTNPGPGGFYDNLGNFTGRNRVVPGAEFGASPDFRKSWVIGFDDNSTTYPMSWRRFALALYEQPLRLRYEGLDKSGAYRIHVVYGGENQRVNVRLTAEGAEIHPFMKKPLPVRPIEFDLPTSATADGVLELEFQQESGRGGNGRGCQVSEVFLIKVK